MGKPGGHDKVLNRGGRGKDNKFTGLGIEKTFSEVFGWGDILESVVNEKN